MKKVLIAVLLLALIVSGCGHLVSAGGRPEKIQHVVLSENSYYMATYVAKFCNLGQCWSDTGEIKAPLFGFFFNTPRVYTSYLRGDQASLTLGAKSGWNWVYDEGNSFTRPSWILEREE